MINLLLVDDQALVRQGLRMRLALEPDINIVGEAADGPTALALAATLRPDVVLMDVELPTMDGVAVAAQFQANLLTSAVVMLTLHDDAQTRARAKAAGAAAFVAKQDGEIALLHAIRAAAAGTRRQEPEVRIENTEYRI